MKCFLLLLFMITASLTAFSQDSLYAYPQDEYSSQINPDCKRPANMISVNPLRYFDFYEASYYRKISCSGIIGMEAMVPSESDISGWGAALEYRHYFFHNAFPGFYLAPRAAYHDLKSEKTKKEKSLFTVAFIAGWQFVFSDTWTLGAGFGIEVLGKEEEDKPEYDRYSGTAPFLRLELGLLW
jgi:hypothetical protein